MPKLSDTQTILLSTASRREDRAIHPLPDSLKDGLRATKAIAALMKAGLAEERDQTPFATRSGLLAIGVTPDDTDVATPSPAAASTVASTSKSAMVVSLLQREHGVSLPELIAATGWLPHTTRATLTGLRKKGHTIERFKRDDATCYRIAN